MEHGRREAARGAAVRVDVEPQEWQYIVVKANR